jgi:hypothetical protein
MFYPTSTTPISFSFNENLKNIISEVFIQTPNIADDYYVSLLDWSVNDMIAFVIGTQVYVVDGSPYPSLLHQQEEEDNSNNSKKKSSSLIQTDSPYVLYEFNKKRDGNINTALYFDELEDDLEDPEITISSLSFDSFGAFLSVGCLDGSISIVDIETKSGL